MNDGGDWRDKPVPVEQKKIIEIRFSNANMNQHNPSSTSHLKKSPPNHFLFMKAGLPLILFSIGASYVVKSAIEGKQKEYDASKNYVSK